MCGNSETMMSLTTYDNNDVMSGIIGELQHCVTEAMKAGIPRWNIILDPGIGFAKDLNQNIQILRQLSRISNQSFNTFPVLVGPSRKGFLGKLTQQDTPSNRIYATSAACAACISNGADILRVHDVKEMKDVLIVSDHIWRTI